MDCLRDVGDFIDGRIKDDVDRYGSRSLLSATDWLNATRVITGDAGGLTEIRDGKQSRLEPGREQLRERANAVDRAQYATTLGPRSNAASGSPWDPSSPPPPAFSALETGDEVPDVAGRAARIRMSLPAEDSLSFTTLRLRAG